MLKTTNEFNLPDMNQYRNDDLHFRANKICIIEIQTADATIAFAGIDLYTYFCSDIIESIKRKYRKNPVFQLTKMYAFNYKCLVFADFDKVSDKDFTNFCRLMHDDFVNIKSNIAGLTCVNRFVAILHHKAPVEFGIQYLFTFADKMDTFFIFDEKSCTPDTKTNDLSVLALLHRAITHRLVTPYYQAIHNNSTKQIEKYESLMRIVDLDNTVYSPYLFLELSKKYKLYTQISRIMIEQVFKDFSKRSDQVSINLTLYDVDSFDFRHWFLNELKRFPHPEDVTIEFLESEDVHHTDAFFNFIKEVRKLGCKIAIDDFGTGYSTLNSILQLEPDFVKIDGSIIQKVLKNDNFILLLDMIQFLTQKLGGKTIAEFVENSAIQKVLEDYNIAYSQGYHFAKPLPLASLPKSS